METHQSTVYELREIFSEMGLKPCMSSFEVVAKDLSRLAQKEPAWTKKYIHSVYHNCIHASPALAKAISALAQIVDGTPKGIAGTVSVKVIAQPDMPEGVFIPTTAKVIKCARPGCPVWFVRTHSTQIYHDISCRRKPDAA